jgi:hypothetical protein
MKGKGILKEQFFIAGNQRCLVPYFLVEGVLWKPEKNAYKYKG